MRNIQIGQINGIVSTNRIVNSNVIENCGVVISGNEVVVNGVKMPPCPGKGHNSTIINNKVFLNGYELINGEWRKTLRAFWYKWF